MFRGITPTFTLTLPEGVDLALANHVYVTLGAKGAPIMQKADQELTIDANVVSVYLDQAETLKLPEGEVQIQINWTYAEAGTIKRACSEIASTWWQKSLEDGVLA